MSSHFFCLLFFFFCRGGRRVGVISLCPKKGHGHSSHRAQFWMPWVKFEPNLYYILKKFMFIQVQSNPTQAQYWILRLKHDIFNFPSPPIKFIGSNSHTLNIFKYLHFINSNFVKIEYTVHILLYLRKIQIN